MKQSRVLIAGVAGYYLERKASFDRVRSGRESVYSTTAQDLQQPFSAMTRAII